MNDSETTKAAERKIAIERFKNALDKHESHTFMMVLGSAMCVPKGADEEATKLKLDAAMDAFQQGFKLLRDIIG